MTCRQQAAMRLASRVYGAGPHEGHNEALRATQAFAKHRGPRLGGQPTLETISFPWRTKRKTGFPRGL
eukprot:6159177-Alexandrium_andersonii.AAC.1